MKLSITEIKKLRDIYFKLHYSHKFYKGGLYTEQILISDAIIEQFINGHSGIGGKDIYVNVTRQYGKSEIAFGMIGFLMIFMPRLLGRGVTIGITINKQDQVNSNYTKVRDTLRLACPYYNLGFVEDSQKLIRLTNGSKLVIFSMEAKNNEGETLDFSVVDEAQALNDEKYSVEILPMLLRTGGVTLYLGVGGYRMNGYYYGLLNENNVIFKYDCYQVGKTVKEYAEKYQDERHLLYFNGIQAAKQKAFEDGKIEAFETQFELKWKVGNGDRLFLNFEEFSKYRIDFEELTYKKEEKDAKSILEQITSLYLGIDWAITGDRTVATVSGEFNGKKYILDTFAIKEKDTPYPEQILQIQGWLTRNNYLQRIKKAYFDATGVGKATTGIFLDKVKGIEVVDITFGEKRKNELATNFRAIYQMGSLVYTSNDKENLEDFEKEMKHLQLEYGKNGYLKYHHPDKGNIHDDFVDSAFLSLLFNIGKKNGGGNVDIYAKKTDDFYS